MMLISQHAATDHHDCTAAVLIRFGLRQFGDDGPFGAANRAGHAHNIGAAKVAILAGPLSIRRAQCVENLGTPSDGGLCQHDAGIGVRNDVARLVDHVGVTRLAKTNIADDIPQHVHLEPCGDDTAVKSRQRNDQVRLIAGRNPHAAEIGPACFGRGEPLRLRDGKQVSQHSPILAGAGNHLAVCIQGNDFQQSRVVLQHLTNHLGLRSQLIASQQTHEVQGIFSALQKAGDGVTSAVGGFCLPAEPGGCLGAPDRGHDQDQDQHQGGKIGEAHQSHDLPLQAARPAQPPDPTCLTERVKLLHISPYIWLPAFPAKDSGYSPAARKRAQTSSYNF